MAAGPMYNVGRHPKDPHVLSNPFLARVVLALPLALVLAGCAEWPRWSHLPEDPDAMEAPDDPRALVQREWTPLAELGDQPGDPTEVEPLTLLGDTAMVVSGSLDGTGWNDLAVPPEIADPDCSGASAPRNPTDDGDWLADVDVYVISTAAADVQLCVEVDLDDAETGWDLLLAPLDDCHVPDSFAERDGAWLGYALGGAGGGWGQPIAPDVPYAVFFAGYYPNARDVETTYRLGLSLVPATGDGIALCPLLPEEAR